MPSPVRTKYRPDATLVETTVDNGDGTHTTTVYDDDGITVLSSVTFDAPPTGFLDI